jgi:hypothetical protein
MDDARLMAPQPNASPSVPLRLAAIVLAIVAVGLPVNNLYAYGLLAVAALVVFTGKMTTDAGRWIAAIILAVAVFALHMLAPSPRIEEGHNAFLIGRPGGALEAGLPSGAFRIMAEQFSAAYPPERRCRQGEYGCWGAGGLPEQTFALAADGALERPAYSRRVTGIDFDSPIWLRLGFINDLSLNLIGRDGELERARRDRRSLAIFGRWHLMLPYFVMYRFPADFAGANLCWRGELLWEGANAQFERLDSKDWRCRVLQADDIGRRIFGVSIAPNADLAMSLAAPWSVKARRALDAATAAAAVVGLLLLLARWRPRRAILPMLLIGAALLVITLIDATFIGGFRPLDAGDDGLTFSGLARQMLHDLVNHNIAGVVQGGESVFFFAPGMRYLRMIEYLAFGDTFLGYLAVMLVLPLVVSALAARFLGAAWGLVFAFCFVAIPVGVLFGSSYLQYTVWAARGFSDPLAATCFLAALVLLAGRAGVSFDDRVARAFFGALLMAIAVVIRPNLAPGVGVILGGVGLAALWQLRVPRLVALCAGFLPVFFPLWHNWYFGGVLVPFTTTMTDPLNYVMPPAAYGAALGELMRLDFAGEHVRRAAGQFFALLSGPSESVFMVPIHLIAIVLVLRVAGSRRYEPMLRLVALAALALALAGLIYVVWPRYHFLTWLLAALAVAAWTKVDGLALIDRYRPTWRKRLSRSVHVARAARAVSWLNRQASA